MVWMVKLNSFLRMLIYHPATATATAAATANHNLMYALTTIINSKNSLVKVNQMTKGNLQQGEQGLQEQYKYV